MMDASNSNGNLTNATRGLKPFIGKDPTLLECWYEKPSSMLSKYRPDIHNVMEGHIRPTTETSTGETPLPQRRAAFTIEMIINCSPFCPWQRRDQHATLFASLWEGSTGIHRHAQKAWMELHSKYMAATYDTVPYTSAEFVAATMKPGQDPYEYFIRTFPPLRQSGEHVRAHSRHNV